MPWSLWTLHFIFITPYVSPVKPRDVPKKKKQLKETIFLLKTKSLLHKKCIRKMAKYCRDVEWNLSFFLRQSPI